jgi:NADH-quinone oxidoreductase subunit H
MKENSLKFVLMRPWEGLPVTYFVCSFIFAILFVVFLLIATAFYTLAERKIMASVQRRLGPNVVGFWGLAQPLADGLKLVLKEIIIPRRADPVLFVFSPYLSFVLSVLGWSVIPFGFGVVFADVPMSLLFASAVSSLGVYGIVLAGWASNSRYALMGAIRSASQMMSYEISMGFCFLTIVLATGSLNLISIVHLQCASGVWNVFAFYPLFIIFYISVLAETNRAPFDLPEAEAELVSGYNTEYSSITFALFFLAEYSNMLRMSGLIVILFFGGWDSYPLTILPDEICFSLKLTIIAYSIVLVRATLPRFRYDQLLRLGWKVCFPISLAFFLFYLAAASRAGSLPAGDDLQLAIAIQQDSYTTFN